eukprot:gnl/TRDRNA2_/TRDRNA2_169557_c0_seq2.p1 gnl/TRDRNA2_/TRDRNA2_169557_c0~~gnl/TRDRNA2_/TRDRNA2_169557_c0_seq2.p1  ORF type:complete len:429 (-),score=44.57 gnl/TRDRNA2_/TRDRNA2_169557_c0_seq2:41-1327(-)
MSDGANGGLSELEISHLHGHASWALCWLVVIGLLHLAYGWEGLLDLVSSYALSVAMVLLFWSYYRRAGKPVPAGLLGNMFWTGGLLGIAMVWVLNDAGSAFSGLSGKMFDSCDLQARIEVCPWDLVPVQKLQQCAGSDLHRSCYKVAQCFNSMYQNATIANTAAEYAGRVHFQKRGSCETSCERPCQGEVVSSDGSYEHTETGLFARCVPLDAMRIENDGSFTCNAYLFTVTTLAVGLVEELSKAIFVVLRLYTDISGIPSDIRHDNSALRPLRLALFKLAQGPHSYFLACLSAGAGFETLETLLYIGKGSTNRLLLCTGFLHTLWTGYVGLRLAQLVYREVKCSTGGMLVRALPLPVLMHGTWDYVVFANGSKPWALSNSTADCCLWLLGIISLLLVVVPIASGALEPLNASDVMREVHDQELARVN